MEDEDEMWNLSPFSKFATSKSILPLFQARGQEKVRDFVYERAYLYTREVLYKGKWDNLFSKERYWEIFNSIYLNCSEIHPASPFNIYMSHLAKIRPTESMKTIIDYVEKMNALAEKRWKELVEARKDAGNNKKSGESGETTNSERNVGMNGKIPPRIGKKPFKKLSDYEEEEAQREMEMQEEGKEKGLIENETSRAINNPKEDQEKVLEEAEEKTTREEEDSPLVQNEDEEEEDEEGDEDGDEDGDEMVFHKLTKSVGSALFSLHSQMNHSCHPNTKTESYRSPYANIEVVALEPIKKGEEICIDYIGFHMYEDMNWKERQQVIKAKYGFECMCKACKAR